MVLRESMQLLKAEFCKRLKVGWCMVQTTNKGKNFHFLFHLPAGKLLFKVGDMESWFIKPLLIYETTPFTLAASSLLGFPKYSMHCVVEDCILQSKHKVSVRSCSYSTVPKAAVVPFSLYFEIFHFRKPHLIVTLNHALPPPKLKILLFSSLEKGCFSFRIERAESFR